MFTISELLEIFIDGGSQSIKVFDISDDDVSTVWEGVGSDLPSWLENVLIQSVDNVYGDADYIGINIDGEELDCENEDEE